MASSEKFISKLPSGDASFCCALAMRVQSANAINVKLFLIFIDIQVLNCFHFIKETMIRSDITNLMAIGIQRSFKNENINPKVPI